MLDSDAASVTSLKMDAMTTGTAPFDADDAAGDDSGAKNAVVRSFDYVSYDYTYMVTPDSPMQYYKSARVGFCFELPYSSDMVTFALDRMNWVDQTPGFQPKATQETVDGKPTQVLTAYRLLTPTSASPTTVPGTSAIQLAVKAGAAPNGFKFAPTVFAWANPNDVTHRTRSNAPPVVTVSAKPSYNVRLGNEAPSENSTNLDYDFGVDQSAPNASLGKRRGVMSKILFGFDMRWADRDKGLKGIELPQGDVSFDLTVKNAWRDEGASTNHAAEAALQPYLWDVGVIDGGVDSTQWPARPQALRDAGFIPRYDSYSMADGLSADSASHTYGNGRYSITEKRSAGKSVYHITIHDYKVDASKLPTFGAARIPGTQCATAFMDASCTDLQVGEVSAGMLYLVEPTEIQGKSVPDYYGADSNLQVVATDGNLMASSATGQKLPAAADASNQALDSDDRKSMPYTMRRPGSFAQEISYACQSDPYALRNGNDCGGWTRPDAKSGTDSNLQGASQRIHTGSIYHTSVEDLPVLALNLVKFDPAALEPLADGTFGALKDNARASLQGAADPGWSAQPGSTRLQWAVKKNGKAWASDDEQRKTTIDQMAYYSTLAEARSHGVVEGVLLASSGAPDRTQASNGSSSEMSFPTINLHVRDAAKLGMVAQLTGQATAWSRSQLAGQAGLDPVNSSDADWDAWAARQVDVLALYRQTKPAYSYGSNGYEKAKYDDTGYLGGESADILKGDSLYIAGEKPVISINPAQKGEDGSPKSVYNLDKEQRSADYQIVMRATTNSNSANGDYLTDLYPEVTLPKGVSYLPGSSKAGGSYQERTPQAGVVTGGEANEPTATVNEDGTTTLKWTVSGVKCDGSDTRLYFSAQIGDPTDPDKDVRNNDQLLASASITTKRNKAQPSELNGTLARKAIVVSRTHSSSLATRADPLLNEQNSTLGWTNMLANFSTDAKANPFAADVMPWNGSGSSSKFSGSTTLTGLKVSGANGAKLDNVDAWFTTDAKYRSVDATTITRGQVTGWTKATIDRKTGAVTIPKGLEQPTAWGFTSDSLPANSRYNLAMSVKATGNQPADYYVNSWTDGDNRVDAVSQIAQRQVNGTTWYDYNGDGIRESADPAMPGVKVSLADASGKPVVSLADGKPLATVTGKDGSYRLAGVPAGTGYVLRFDPADGTTWHAAEVTAKNAKDASEASDSDSDPVNVDGKLDHATIALKEFPAIGSMSTPLYSDNNEDSALTGTLDAKTTLTASKNVTGRADGQWLDKEGYALDIAPRATPRPTPCRSPPRSTMPGTPRRSRSTARSSQAPASTRTI